MGACWGVLGCACSSMWDPDGIAERVIPREEMEGMCEPEADKPESGSRPKAVDLLRLLIPNHPQLKSYETALKRNGVDSPEAM